MLRSPLPFPLALPARSPSLASPHHLSPQSNQYPRRCPSPLALPLSPCPATAPLSPWFAQSGKRKRSFTPSSPLPLGYIDADRASSLADSTHLGNVTAKPDQDQAPARPVKRVRFHSHAPNAAGEQGSEPTTESRSTPDQRPGATPLTASTSTTIPIPSSASPSPLVLGRSRSWSDSNSNSLNMLDTASNTSADHNMDDHIEMEDQMELTKRPRMTRVDSDNSTSSVDSIISNSSESSDMPSTSTRSRTSSPSLPPRLHLKRPNLKKLSLALPTSSYSASSSDSTPTAICPSPISFNGESSSHNTPYTPGPPKTPALAMSLGRATMRNFARPSLLSLITQPSMDDDVPPTPGAAHPYATNRAVRGKARARSYTTAEMLSHPSLDRGGSKSAYPLSISTFASVDEAGPITGNFGFTMPTSLSSQSGSASPDTSPSTSTTGSTATTPSTSPPLATAYTFNMPMSFPSRAAEPYEDGPVQVLPGVFIGAEDSVHHLSSFASGSFRVRIINVAQEIDDPFDPLTDAATYGWFNGNKGKGKEKMKLAMYPAMENRPEVEYCHVRWSHGEMELAEIPAGSKLEELLNPSVPESGKMWRFWEAIRWMEAGRRADIPILIHCQCGVSRSATLTIAYTMALAAIGVMPDLLGHIRSMQDAYDFVKGKSPWIGPNHSLVFQLVDFARTLTTLLSTHLAQPNATPIQTSFPSRSDAELSEAEWARKRAEFDLNESADGSEIDVRGGGGGGMMSPEEAGDEAKLWDQAMLARKAQRGEGLGASRGSVPCLDQKGESV